MTLDKFYEDMDSIVGTIKTHLVKAPVRPSGDKVMEAVRATS